MEISLTELRQRLFELADRVLDTGEAIFITRRGARLKIVRDEPELNAFSRMAKLVPQQLEVGHALDPHESPAQWSELQRRVAEPQATYLATGTNSKSKPSPIKTKTKINKKAKTIR